MDESLSLVPHKDLWETPWSSEDGGGLHSEPDWSRPDRTVPDVFQCLRTRFFKHILDNKLYLQFLAHIDHQNPEPPFDDKTVDTFRSFISDFLEENSCIADWTIRPHQPMTWNIMSQLSFIMQDHVETPFEKRIVTLIYKRKFSKVLLKKQMRILRKSF